MSSEHAARRAHVALIGLDAWGSYSFSKADMPVVKRMAEHGAYTLEARSVRPSSSACNWASMIMGVGPDIHGYTAWDTSAPVFETPLDHYGLFPTVFALLKDQRPDSRAGCFYEWPTIGCFCPDGAAQRKENLKGLSADAGLVEVITGYIRAEKPDFTFAAFDEPDHTGHHDGHDTPAYYQMLTKLDAYVGMIEDAVKDAGIYEDTTFVICADHGGLEKDHGGDSPMERNIPLVLYGRNIRKGHRIRSHVMIYDIAATVAALLGLEIPEIWRGRPVREALLDGGGPSR